MLPPTCGPRWSAGFATKRPRSTATSTRGISALRLQDQVRSRSQKRRSAADPPLDRPSIATTRTRASSEISLPNELSPALARSLDRSGSGLLAPPQLGFARRRKVGSARGPFQSRVQPETCSTKRHPPWRPPLGGHLRTSTEAPERMSWQRGSGSEEPSPIAKPATSSADSIADPDAHR
jgi:hypothetical protein